MSEDGIRGEVVGGVHEMRSCGRCFSSAAYTRFRITDDAVVNIDNARLKQWRQCEDVRGGIASRVGNETSLPDLIAVKFWATVDCFGLQLSRKFGVRIL